MRGKSLLLFFLLILLSPVVLPGGTASAQPERIQFERLSADEGLSNFSVTCIVQDSIGFIWIGTEHGLNRYDGYTIRNYYHRPGDTTTLSSNDIACLHVDRRGTLWVGTPGGLNRFDWERDRFVRYKHDPADPRTIGSDNIPMIREDTGGKLWLATGVSGIDILDPTTGAIGRLRHEPGNANSLSSDTVSMIWFDRGGSLWASYQDGVDVYEPATGRFRHFSLDAIGMPPGKPENRGVYDYADLDRNWILMGSFTGLSIFDTKLGRPVEGVLPLTRIQPEVFSLCRDRRGRIWVGTFGAGLSIIDPASGGVSSYRFDPADPASLSADRVTAILEDRTGAVWIGCWKGGVNRYDPGKIRFTHVRASPGDPAFLDDATVWCFLEDHEGVLWIGTAGGGLNRRDPVSGRFSHYTDAAVRRETGGEDPINAIAEDRHGRIWIGAGSGLKQFDRRSGAFHNQTPNDLRLRQMSTLSADGDGNLWFGTYQGTFGKLEPEYGRVTTITFPESLGVAGGVPGAISAVRIRKNGDVWIATFGAGAFRYAPRTGEFRRFVHSPDDPRTLGANLVYSIHEDATGSLWIGTFDDGLNRYVDADGTFEHFTTSEGLPDGFVKSILSDRRGILWMGTNKGLARFDPDSRMFSGFGVADGLQANEFRTGSCFADRQGRLYFGGVNGYNVFDPDSVRPNPIPPPVVITEINVHNRAVPLSGELRLEHDQNVISLDFVALNFTNPSRNRYAYMMEGVDQNWIDCGTRRNTNYSNLDDGEYVFRVKASNNDGIWNEEGASLNIVITPPWWKTWWFRISAAVLVFIMGGWTVRSIEMRKIKERMRLLEQEAALERERSRIARDMHDDVGARLTEMRLLSELSQRTVHDPAATKSNLDELSGAARSIVDSFQEIVWSVNPRYDTLDGFADYLTQYAHGYLSRAGLRCRLDIPADIAAVRMPADVRHNMMMVVKEILNNAVKHAGAGEVGLRLELAGGSVRVTIRDDGRGFSTEGVRGFGNGLLNMRQRAESIGGEVRIASAPGAGTKVTLEVALTGLTGLTGLKK